MAVWSRTRLRTSIRRPLKTAIGFDAGCGYKVCVRNRFLGEWTTGFKVAEVLGDGYRIRRLSDDHVFPDVFAFEDVRLERRKQPLRGITGSYLDRRH